MEEGFELLTELPFDLDHEEADRSVTEILDDDTLQLLKRENRVGLARGTPGRVDSAEVEPGRQVVDVPLLFLLHPHPECTFSWSRIVIDLAPTPGTVIADMVPRGVEDLPVDVETKVGVGLKFSTVVKAVDVEASPELARKRTVYFPTMSASGTGFHKGYWDFFAKAGDYLHADKELRLLIDSPEDTPVKAAVVVRAKVRFRGFARLIPLLARTGEHSREVQLT